MENDPAVGVMSSYIEKHGAARNQGRVSRLSDVQTLELYPYAQHWNVETVYLDLLRLLLRLLPWLLNPSRHRHDLFKARKAGSRVKNGENSRLLRRWSGTDAGAVFVRICVLWKGSEKYLRFVYSGSASRSSSVSWLSAAKKQNMYKKVQQNQKNFMPSFLLSVRHLCFFFRNWHTWKKPTHFYGIGMSFC